MTYSAAGRFGGASLSQQEVFQRGLICDVDPSATLLTCFEEAAEASAGTARAPGSAAAQGGAGRLGHSRGVGGGSHQASKSLIAFCEITSDVILWSSSMACLRLRTCMGVCWMLAVL